MHTFEQQLQQRCSYRGTIPYWDWTLGTYSLPPSKPLEKTLTNSTRHYTTDVADMQNMTLLSDNPSWGMGRWGNASNDDQITTGGWKDFRVSYPVPNHIRRRYTIEPFASMVAQPLFPDPTRLANETLTLEKVKEALNDCGEGDFVCLQTHVEGFQNIHGGGHSVLGGGKPFNIVVALRGKR